LRGKPDEGVAGLDVEVDVGEGFDAVAVFDLCDELEEEAQFADFDGLVHDVDAVEVVDDDGFVYVVFGRGMAADVSADGLEEAGVVAVVGAVRGRDGGFVFVLNRRDTCSTLWSALVVGVV